MASTGSWANLSRDMLACIAVDRPHGLSLGDYARLRGVCTAWHSALAPPFPSLIGLPDGGCRASVFSLPAQRSFRLYVGSCALGGSLYDNRYKPADPIHSHASIVGSGSGRLAVAINSRQSAGSSELKYWTARIFLIHPRSGEEAELCPPSTADDERVRKVVFARNRPHGGPKDWPTVVALYGGNKVAYIDATKSKEEWTTVDIPGKFFPVDHIVDLAFHAGGGTVYCLDLRGGVRVLRIPHDGQNTQDPAVAVEPLLTPPPLLVPSVDVAPPYDEATERNPTKHLFFCEGSLYHVWRTKRMRRDEIMVLRFDPERRPWWDAVKDLGGCSVFVSENSDPAVVRGVRGVRADCVYWVNNVAGISVVMVHDVATGTSDLHCKNKGNCCWFVDDDSVTSSVDNKKKKRKRCSR